VRSRSSSRARPRARLGLVLVGRDPRELVELPVVAREELLASPSPP
jgi:hypothetical protein